MTQEAAKPIHALSVVPHVSTLPAGINLGYGHIKLATPAGDFITASAFAQPTGSMMASAESATRTWLMWMARPMK
jgi:hypothetical protein